MRYFQSWKVVVIAVLYGLVEAGDIQCTFIIDKSNVPANNWYDITLKVDACGATAAALSVDGSEYPASITNDRIMITTAADSVRVTLINPIRPENAGRFERAALRDDKKWAISFGFDDNTMLADMINAMNNKGYAGTCFMIGNQISLIRDERNWIVDAPQMRDLYHQGWVFGNHTWSHAYAKNVNAQADILQCEDTIHQCLQSVNPFYKVTSFAAPMFDSDYHPIILAMRNNKMGDVLFNESGNNSRIRVDAGRPAYNGWVSFDFDRQIGRDYNLESGLGAVRGTIDSMHTYANDTLHFWYNLLSHGGHGSQVAAVVDYLKQNYDQEAWVAPSAQIYAYLEMREKADISVVVDGVTAVPARLSFAPVAGGDIRGVISIDNRRVILSSAAEPFELVTVSGVRIAGLLPGCSFTLPSAGCYALWSQRREAVLITVR